MKSVSDLICLFDEFLLTEDILFAIISSNIATKLEKYRIEHDMSEKELTEYLDLPLEAVNSIDDRCHDFKLSELCKIAVKIDKMLEVKLV